MSTHEPDHPAPESTLDGQLLCEIRAMAQYALASGMTVTPADAGHFARIENLETTEQDCAQRMSDLAKLHNRLAKLIAPATPRTILLLARESRKKGPFLFLGPIPLVRRLMLVACLSLVAFLLLSLSPYVNEATDAGDPLRGSGIPLLYNHLFLLAAAALGASFAALMRVYRYIDEGTYDPRYESSYWIRFVLGIIGGVILAQILQVDPGEELQHTAGRPAMAMLGGFSSSLVYQILNRLLASVERLVRDDSGRQLETERQAAKTEVAQGVAAERVRLATDLLALRARLGDDGAANTSIQSLVDRLLPKDEDADDDASNGAVAAPLVPASPPASQSPPAQH